MKNVKKILAWALVLVLAFSLVACGSNSSNAKTSDTAARTTTGETKSSDTTATTEPAADNLGNKELIMTVIITDPFFLSIEKKFKELAEKDGYHVTFMDPNIKNDALQKMIEDIIVKKPAGVAFAPWDDSHINMVKQLLDAGITTVTYNVPLTEDLIPTILNGDYEGGVVGGEAASTQWKKDNPSTEPIIGIVGQPQIGANVKRANGFIDGFKKLYPDVKVKPIADGKGDRAKTLAAASDLIQANPDINCFFGINDNTAMGIVDALKEQNKADSTKYSVTGFGGSTPVLDEMKKPGSVIKTEVGQQPTTMGELTYKALLDAIKGEKGYKLTVVPAVNVTAAEADKFLETQYPK
ncbi:MAG TPA: substrate-binding domain-containing protein [Ruminiclostridium sp.]